MKPAPARRLAVGALVLLAAQAGSALTLGRAQGAALIGRPLDVGIAMAPDAGGTADAACAQAEVFYGEGRVAADRVSTSVEVTAGATGSVRVRAGAPVDEPVVTVYLRIGCNQQLTRRYVLLSEQPPELPQPGASAAVPVPPAPVAAPRSVSSSDAPARPAAAATRASSPAGVTAQRPAVRAPSRQRQAAPAVSAARLKLEPLDLAIERDPALRLSTAMMPPGQTSPQQRAEALARWQAINAQPDDLLRTAQRVQAMDNDIQALREGMLKNDAYLADLRTQLERAHRERYANGLVYGLLAALLAAVAAASFFWRRGSRPAALPDWWHSQAPGPDFGAESAPARLPVTSPMPADAKALDLELDFTAGDTALHKSAAALPARAPVAAPARPVFSESLRAGGTGPRASVRALNAEELSDIQQQADFFVSLGEYEQAVEVLRGHIIAHPEASAIAWLDLLEIFHKLQRRGDYEDVRGEFQRIFNAQLPSFDAYREAVHGLEAYPQALSRIQALWPSRKVLDVIEDSIFRKPDAGPIGEAFGLQAYRELLLLHDMATELVSRESEPDGDDGPTSSFVRTQIQPLSASMAWKPPDGAALAPIGFADIGLDINLDDLGTGEPMAGTAGKQRQLPPLDFDTSAFDSVAEDASRRRN